MGFHSSPVDSDPANPDWHEIEDALDHLADAARSTHAADAFYRLLLDAMLLCSGLTLLWAASR